MATNDDGSLRASSAVPRTKYSGCAATSWLQRSTVTFGWPATAASMAALLLAAGEAKKRLALPNSRILIHQPSMGGLSGQATDIDIHAREILRIREITNNLMAKHTGQPLERIERDVERDFIMTANQAKEYGIVDEIIDRPKS